MHEVLICFGWRGWKEVIKIFFAIGKSLEIERNSKATWIIRENTIKQHLYQVFPFYFSFALFCCSFFSKKDGAVNNIHRLSNFQCACTRSKNIFKMQSVDQTNSTGKSGPKMKTWKKKMAAFFDSKHKIYGLLFCSFFRRNNGLKYLFPACFKIPIILPHLNSNNVQMN